MNIRKEIKNNLKRIERNNQARTKRYKEGIKKKIAENLKNGQSVASNQPLINRYYSAKPQGFTQIQQAMENAVS